MDDDIAMVAMLQLAAMALHFILATNKNEEFHNWVKSGHNHNDGSACESDCVINANESEWKDNLDIVTSAMSQTAMFGQMMNDRNKRMKGGI